MPLFDLTLTMTLENFAVPADYFSDFALCVGKQNAASQTFQNNMQNLAKGSKLLVAKPPSDRSVLDKLELESVFELQRIRGRCRR